MDGLEWERSEDGTVGSADKDKVGKEDVVDWADWPLVFPECFYCRECCLVC